jgi:hypothetical protein
VHESVSGKPRLPSDSPGGFLVALVSVVHGRDYTRLVPELIRRNLRDKPAGVFLKGPELREQ